MDVEFGSDILVFEYEFVYKPLRGFAGEINRVAIRLLFFKHNGRVSVCGSFDVYQDTEEFVIPILLKPAVDKSEGQRFSFVIFDFDLAHIAGPVPYGDSTGSRRSVAS